MNIIFVGRNHGKSKTLKLGNRQLILFVFALVIIMSLIFTSGFLLNRMLFAQDESVTKLNPETIALWKASLVDQQEEVATIKRLTQEKVDALTLRMGDMQARLLRLDALGLRLTEVAKLNNGEFDFSSPPALGGPIESEVAESYRMPELEEALSLLVQQITDREQQLEVIDELFVSRNIQNELFIAGRPITWGWMSSAYGYRTDPFNGRRAWHGGVDFAGKEDSDIIAVASGVVTWSGDRYGYGNLIEINHGGGFSTRYAHCKDLYAKVGDVVEKGQSIAAMGSTGRSTGPHVHYEVLKNGKSINPKKYIHRASR